MSLPPLSLGRLLCDTGAGEATAPVAWPTCVSVNCKAQYGGQCPAADRPRDPHLRAGEESVPSGSRGSELSGSLANEGSLGFYSTRISISTTTHDTKTAVTTKHNQQMGGTWEGRLRKEEGGPGDGHGPGDGRGPGDVATFPSNTNVPGSISGTARGHLDGPGWK